MEAFAFVGFIVLDVLVFTLLRLKLASNRSEKRQVKGLKPVPLQAKDSETESALVSVVRFASLLTLAIVIACLFFGTLWIFSRDSGSLPSPRTDPFLLMALTGLGVVLTLLCWAGALIVATPIMMVRSIVEFCARPQRDIRGYHRVMAAWRMSGSTVHDPTSSRQGIGFLPGQVDKGLGGFVDHAAGASPRRMDVN